MKKAKGFILLETAMLLLFIFSLLITTLYSYNHSLRQALRLQELIQASNYCEAVLMGEAEGKPQGFTIRQQREDRGDYVIIDIQVLKDEEIIYNLLQLQ